MLRSSSSGDAKVVCNFRKACKSLYHCHAARLVIDFSRATVALIMSSSGLAGSFSSSVVKPRSVANLTPNAKYSESLPVRLSHNRDSKGQLLHRKRSTKSVMFSPAIRFQSHIFKTPLKCITNNSFGSIVSRGGTHTDAWPSQSSCCGYVLLVLLSVSKFFMLHSILSIFF